MKTYLPQIASGPTPASSGAPSIAEQLFAMMRDDPGQKRVGIKLDLILCTAIQLHCEDMVKRGFFGHVTPEGVWPNKRVRLTGYRLVDWYMDDANNVESIAGGYKTVEDVWQSWLSSPIHRTHVLGLESFVDQVNVGVGFAFMDGASLFDFCWGIVSAQPETK